SFFPFSSSPSLPLERERVEGEEGTYISIYHFPFVITNLYPYISHSLSHISRIHSFILAFIHSFFFFCLLSLSLSYFFLPFPFLFFPFLFFPFLFFLLSSSFSPLRFRFLLFHFRRTKGREVTLDSPLPLFYLSFPAGKVLVCGGERGEFMIGRERERL
ncbi:MAG: hypothetical protein ACTS42_01905, partial [Candidatus Hodgkinia cicadicola]